MSSKKRPYVKPEIKEETYILTVSAWVTQTPTLTKNPQLAAIVQETPVLSRIFQKRAARA